MKSKYKGVKWYISSDSSDVLNKLVKEFPNKIIIGNGLMGHVEEDPNAYERAILDVELMSRCNELVVTGGTTFGKLKIDESLKKNQIIKILVFQINFLNIFLVCPIWLPIFSYFSIMNQNWV